MTSTASGTQFEQLLNRFRILPRTRPAERTFMQIAGYPHLENVASNILEFYFNPHNPHGLQTLFLDTLLDLLQHRGEINPQFVELHREETTAANKRIDLLIETDTLVIAIENKVFHTAINPFDEYRRHLEDLRQERVLLCVLLCLQPPIGGRDLHGFQPISYRSFFSHILAHLGTYVLAAKEPYLTYLRDFIRTLLELGQETTMNPHMLSFFHQNRTDVEGLLNEIQLLREDMKQKTKDLAGLIDTSHVNLSVIQGSWKDDTQLFQLRIYQVVVTDRLGLQININLSPMGWRINMFNYKGSRAALEAWLSDSGIPITVRSTQPYRLAYGSDMLPYTANRADVATEVHDLFAKLKTIA